MVYDKARNFWYSNKGVYGFETFVPINRISNLWVSDVREVIQVGEERPVEIVSLVRGKDGRVTKMEVSLRAAEEAPRLQLRGETPTPGISSTSRRRPTMSGSPGCRRRSAARCAPATPWRP